MKIAGFVSELNPFTYGHKYLIDEIRKDGANLIITSMSPNFVMRGEPSIFDKFKRCEMALINGVDIVLEIPTFFSVQSADKYAAKAIELLVSAGITDLYFGIEENDEAKLYRIVELRKGNEYKELLNKYLKEGISFNTSSKKALIELDSSLEETLMNPNNLLGVEYIINIERLNKDINIHMIKRIESLYYDSINQGSLIQSASSIRVLLRSDKGYEYIPYDIKNINKHYLDDYFNLIKYKIDSTSKEELSLLLNISEGIENRLKSLSRIGSVDNLIDSLVSKRNRATKIKRILISILLNIRKDEINDYDYIRVLGFNRIGSSYLKEIKNDKIITQIKRDLPIGIYREIDYTKIYDDSLAIKEYKPIIID